LKELFEKAMDDVKEEEEEEKPEKIDIEKTQQEKIEEEKFNKVCDDIKENIVDDVDDRKKMELNRMVNNIFGVLLSLKQNGDFNLAENRYLNDLHSVIYEEHADAFREINSILFNICTK
jgi:hypothetical protein